ncbi:MAG: SDR family NAD(P)-dependent oxidoreductase [Rubrivivax sp.]|nr:SDR family NAD(P)-dependent oxidoreductase [Rubrivivax sp.]
MRSRPTLDDPFDENRAAEGQRPLAVVTGASSGIGLELARCCAEEGFDLLLAADRDLAEATSLGTRLGVSVQAVQADLATMAGLEVLLAHVGRRPVEALLANAGHGLGGSFLAQDFDGIRGVVDTNISGTLYLIHAIARRMVAAGSGRILITGSVAGFIPGSYQAVYNASKAFIDSFSWALRNELEGTGVSVTCLMPGATDTEFFARAGMLDTRLGSGRKADPADVARVGFKAMMACEGDVVAGLSNKVEVALAAVTPAAVLAQLHRRMAQPGSAPSR